MPTALTKADIVEAIYTENFLENNMAFHAMMEKFESELLEDIQNLYSDLKSHIATLKLDADSLDAKRTEKWLIEAERLQDNFCTSYRRITDNFLQSQERGLKEINSGFSKSIRAIMHDAEDLYFKYFRYVFWYMPACFVVLLIFLYLTMR